MIRAVCQDDIGAIVEIYNHYVVNSVITFETDPVSIDEMERRICRIVERYPCLVYEQDGKLVGYCYAHQWKEKAAYDTTAETTVYLSPERRGGGVGGELMRALIDECKERGLHALIACITAGNQASIALHERLGFKRVSTFSQVGRKFGEWLDIVDYELVIKHNEL